MITWITAIEVLALCFLISWALVAAHAQLNRTLMFNLEAVRFLYTALAAGCVLILILARESRAEPATGGPLYAGFVNNKRVVVDTTHIVNPWLSLRVDRRMTRDAVSIIRAAGIRYAVGKFKQVDDPFEGFNTGRLYPEHYGPEKYDPFNAEFHYWHDAIGGYIPNWHIGLVTSPPWQFDGVGVWKDGAVPYYAGGAELGRAPHGCLANVSAAEFGLGGAPKYRMSVVARVHELLHCGGAEHIDGQVNMMHPAAHSFAVGNTSIPILPLTVEQVARGLR